MSGYFYTGNLISKEELYHHGILGQKWGIRRFQNLDGSLTEEGKKRYYTPNYQRQTVHSLSNPIGRARAKKNPVIKDAIVRTRDKYKAFLKQQDEYFKLTSKFYSNEELREPFVKQLAEKFYQEERDRNSGTTYDQLYWGIKYDDLDQNDTLDMFLNSNSSNPLRNKIIESNKKEEALWRDYYQTAKELVDNIVGDYSEENVSFTNGTRERARGVVWSIIEKANR